MNNLPSIIGLIVAIIVGTYVVYQLFANFILSRIASITCSGFAIYIAAVNMGENLEAKIWECIILSVFGWLFFRGFERVFDRHETGWVLVYDTGYTVKEMAGGFFAHAAASTALIAIIYYCIGLQHNVFFFIVPTIIIIMDIVSFFVCF